MSKQLLCQRCNLTEKRCRTNPHFLSKLVVAREHSTSKLLMNQGDYSESKPAQIFFIHIEKTAGSSIIESLVKPNVSNTRVGGLRDYLKNRDADCIHGHNPYGFHYFSRRPVKYFTMLRDPLDRAVSWYYFIKDLKRVDLWKRHPLRDYADSVTIVEFYQDPRFSNLQTRYMAGYAYNLAYPFLGDLPSFRKRLLRKAKSHLDECVAFGLQDRFGSSVEVLQKKLGWPIYEPVPRQKKTKSRPTLEEIDALNPQVLSELRKSHELDCALYNYAKERFEEPTGARR